MLTPRTASTPHPQATTPDVRGSGPALARWTALLGQDHVLIDGASIADRYGRTTLACDGPRLVAVLRPSTTEEVRGLVQIARETGIPLYPISRGKNWGYGDALPAVSGHAIVDLGRMNRIVEVNPELGYAVIEPGVTQGQLHDYLTQHDLPLILDSTGAGPDASIVGNTLERGYGHTPYGDHYLSCCGMQVVMADGQLLQTGFGHYAGARTAQLYKWGVGPVLDGLFTQSNFGIVTRLGLWLMPRPERVEVFFLSVDDDAHLATLVDALRPLRMEGTLRSLIHIANDLRAISSLQTYPWAAANGVTPLPDGLRRELRRQGGFGAWVASGALYGSRELVAASRQRLRRALRGLPVQLRFAGPGKRRMASLLARICTRAHIAPRLVRSIAFFDEAYELLYGRPTTAFFKGCLWRVRDPAKIDSYDPLDHGAGLCWLSPVLPATGAAARELVEATAPIYARHGFEPLITLSLANERALLAVMNISFDRRVARERAAAQACYDELLSEVMSRGFVPYRVASQSMQRLAEGSHVFWDVVDELKRALDPQNIFSRGRYQPGALRVTP